MAPPRVVILGGTGMVGRSLARLLVMHTRATVVVAGRTAARARAVADAFDDARFGGVAADVSDPVSLADAVAGARIVINATPSSRGLATVVRAALAAGADCLDTLLSHPEKHAVLYALDPEIRAAGRTVVTDGGFHPGLPALLVRHAAGRLDALAEADVQARLKLDLRTYRSRPETNEEFVRELASLDGRAFIDGRWQQVSAWNPPRADFGPGWGRAWVVPMALKEMEALPTLIPSLRRTGFWIAGFHPMIDMALLPVMALGMRLAPGVLLRPFARLFVAAMRALVVPPYGGVVQMTAVGTRDGATVRLSYRLEGTDLALMTAAPIAATVCQLLDGSIACPGVHCQALLADPARLLADMGAMGVPVAVADC